ncbi:hypothetical protein CYMTET_17534, partial [Cymbomonas tetramitiformis]
MRVTVGRAARASWELKKDREPQEGKSSGKEVKLLKVAEEDFETLEDAQMSVQNMISSRYVEVFRDSVVHWQRTLTAVGDVMTIWGEIQRVWAYLEELFMDLEEVKKELPEDTARFARVDTEVREFLAAALKTPNIVMVCHVDGLYERLERMQGNIVLCEKALTNFLEQKKTVFPRFYFVSTTDLLDILSNGNRPSELMVHMPKIFQAVRSLEIQEKGTELLAVGLHANNCGEHIRLNNPVTLNGKVEMMLQEVISSIASSLRSQLGVAIAKYADSAREDWLKGFPAQLVLVSMLVAWTSETMEAFDKVEKGMDTEAMPQLLEKYIKQLSSLILLVQAPLEHDERMKIMNMITLETHSRDIIDGFVQNNTEDSSQFAWKSQMRFSWVPGAEGRPDCLINICDAQFSYGYEYLGNSPRLVITPLTDRIYITATQSLHLRCGCAPAGPAGTGKTETSKDLGCALGKPVYVFNCSDQMDYRSLGDIFKGLASSGAWGCFDEFNRISAEVLSVCSVQFKCILDAISIKSPTFNLDGTDMVLNPTCGVFITMNPGYLGRTELPESLKALFRPVTVMVPDLELICENMLMAEGFVEAKVLGKKFVTLYMLLKDLLSKQDHYDWGLRAIKSVLVVAGSFKREDPDIPEENLLMRALRDFNLAKIIEEDMVVFMGLLGDLFPGVEVPRKFDPEFEAVLKEMCEDQNLVPNPDFILKVVQFAELLEIRHSIFIMGPSGTGKSETWKLLQKVWVKQGKKTQYRDLNWAALTTGELYGYVQLATREWRDGLLSSMMREFANMPDTNPKWIILDGDLDANWIESMNSVMDDNKILTLASNERIPLLPHMKLIFEIRDLKFGTPATVSRAGILYLQERGQWHNFVSKWVATTELEPELKRRASQLTTSPVLQRRASQLTTSPVLQRRASQLTTSPVLQRRASQLTTSPVLQRRASQLTTSPVPQRRASQLTTSPVLQRRASQLTTSPVLQRCASQLTTSPVLQRRASQLTIGSVLQEYVLTLFDKYVGATLKILRNFKHIAPMLDFNLVQSLCFLLGGLLPRLPSDYMHSKKRSFNRSVTLSSQGMTDLRQKSKEQHTTMETYFVFAAVWAFGGGLSIKDGTDYRDRFSRWWKAEWKTVKFPGVPGGSGTKRSAGVFEFFVDPATHAWAMWTHQLEPFHYTPGTPLGNVAVPTVETVALEHVMELLFGKLHPLLLIGNAGSGKTQLIKGALRRLTATSSEMQVATINLNYYTDAVQMQTVMEQPLEKKAGKNYGPPGISYLVYFIDDLNMPQVDSYNTQTPISLLRQYADYHHWYDRNKLSQKNILNTGVVSAMNPSAGSFTVNERLQRHFAAFAVSHPSAENLKEIYSTFLRGHLAKFSSRLQELEPAMTRVALEIHARVSQLFRKTAHTFHYEFNMRHLTHLFSGLLLTQPDEFKEEPKLVRLLMHEAERVYGDILVSPENISTYRKAVRHILQNNFRGKEFRAEDILHEPLLFSTIRDDVYDDCVNLEETHTLLVQALEAYNEVNARMNLVLFDDAMHHICRILRILRFPNGHVLLVGVGGSGRQSLTRLAAFIGSYSLVQVEINETYTIADLREELKRMYLRAGQKEDDLCLLITDSQISDEKFLVYLNDFLSCGDIPDLFNSEERQKVVDSLRAAAKAAGVVDTPENCWEFFIQRVRAHLHLAMCFSPVGSNFRVRVRRFPALITCSYVDWFQPWPEDALLSVAHRFLHQLDLGEPRVTEGVVHFINQSFQSVNRLSEEYLLQERRYSYTTPKSLLDQITLFTHKLEQKRREVGESIQRLQTGLVRLQSTSRDAAAMEEELNVKQVEVEEKKRAADALVEQVGEEKEKVQAESELSVTEAANCEVKAKEVAEIEVECRKELEKAEPAVAAAELALDTLQKKDLVELKSLKKPPSSIDDVTAACLVLLSPSSGVVKNRMWPESQKMMNLPEKFLDTLKSFKHLIEQEKVPPANFKAVRPYLEIPTFDAEIIKSKSAAAAGLCGWVRNIVVFYDIVSEVAPLRKKLKEAQDQLKGADIKLSEMRQAVEVLQAQFEALEQQLRRAVSEKEQAEAEAETCTRRLNLAQRLVRALASEEVRWATGVRNLTHSLKSSVGDVLLATTFVSYIGGFNKNFRQRLLNEEWIPALRTRGIPMSLDPDPCAILANEAAIAAWNNDGLPADKLSKENGVIITSCERWPLMIDPQLQGISWIKELESKNDLQVVRMGTASMGKDLAHAVEHGRPLLVENMSEHIDPALVPVLGRQTIRKGKMVFMRVAGMEVPLHSDFRVYLHTKLSNPHYPPEVQAEATLVNFAVTEDGLQDQLLARVVGFERPDLETQQSTVIRQQNSFMIQLKDLEDNLLERLSNAEGDILANTELIENLESTKRIAIEVENKVESGRRTAKLINEARDAYRGVAQRGSVLFFLLISLQKMHTFYHYSLGAFVAVFEAGIRQTQEQAETQRGRTLDDASDDEEDEDAAVSGQHQMREGELILHLHSMITNITLAVFNYTRRGLFERHKMVLAAQLALSIAFRQVPLLAAQLALSISFRQVPLLAAQLALSISFRQ